MALKTTSANRKDISTAANGVTLEHRHFAFIAHTLSGFRHDPAITRDQFNNIVERFANNCATTNPKFNRARFVAACGGLHHTEEC